MDILEAFLLGNAAILTNACMLPLYPGLMAFLAGNANNERARQSMALLGVLVLAGIMTVMLLIGAILTLLSASLASVLPILLPIIYGIVIVMGIMMLTGHNPFARLQTTQAPMLKNPYVTAYVYGLFFAPMTLPCTGPQILIAFSLGVSKLASGLIFFFFFGLGFGWPLVVLPILTLAFQRQIVGWLGKHHQSLTVASGILLLAIGIFGILTELVPQYVTNFELTTTMQGIYWALTACITLVSAVIYHQVSQSRQAATDH